MDDINYKDNIKNFLDGEGRLSQYPAKKKYKIFALFYLASKFEAGRVYGEKEVNELLNEWHTFGDWAMLRRDLYDNFFLNRESDCSSYWMEDPQPVFSDFKFDA